MIKNSKALFFCRKLYGSVECKFSNAAKLNYLSYTDASAKTNLVILHGLMGNSLNFRSIATHKDLKSLCNSYLFDLRNHGKSEHKSSMTLDEMAADVDEATKQIGLDKYFILGHSLGGKVAMAYSRLFPQRLHGSIICDIGPFDYNDNTKFKSTGTTRSLLQACANIPLKGLSRKQLAAELDKAANGAKDISGLLMTNLEEVSKDEWRWRVNLESINRSYSSVLGVYQGSTNKYSGPVKVIAGSKSDYVPKDELSEYKKVFENFDSQRDVVYLEGANHWVHFAKPEEFVKEVSSFIKKHEAD